MTPFEAALQLVLALGVGFVLCRLTGRSRDHGMKALISGRLEGAHGPMEYGHRGLVLGLSPDYKVLQSKQFADPVFIVGRASEFPMITSFRPFMRSPDFLDDGVL